MTITRDAQPGITRRSALVVTAWTAPAVAVAVSAPLASASGSGSGLSSTWAVEDPAPNFLAPRWMRFTVTNPSSSDVSVQFFALRQQGPIFLSSVTQAAGWVPIEPSTPTGFHRGATVAAGSERSMLLGFAGESGASGTFVATLTPSTGSSATTSVAISIP